MYGAQSERRVHFIILAPALLAICLPTQRSNRNHSTSTQLISLQ